MKYKLKAYSIWEYGQRKDSQGNPHQEDSLFPAHGELKDSDRLFILCDGMGGHDAGEVASSTVCEAMSESILNDGHDAQGVFTPQDLGDALTAAFDALDAKDSGAAKKMGTTMTLLKLHNAGATVAHIGDSRVYHIRPGKTGEDTRILFETEDHSLVNDLVRIGELTREEAHYSSQKNVITRAMQPNMERRPKADVATITDIRPGDYFYMCSDGMLEQMDMDDGTSLRNIFSETGGTDENRVRILTAVTAPNRDNHTAFIIHILDVEEDEGRGERNEGRGERDREATPRFEDERTPVRFEEDPEATDPSDSSVDLEATDPSDSSGSSDPEATPRIAAAPPRKGAAWYVVRLLILLLLIAVLVILFISLKVSNPQ